MLQFIRVQPIAPMFGLRGGPNELLGGISVGGQRFNSFGVGRGRLVSPQGSSFLATLG
jgi:hypothetical protein